MSRARITWIGGPVLRARMEGPFSVYESLSVGSNTAARRSDPVARRRTRRAGLRGHDRTRARRTRSGTGRSLSVPLGPGLLGGIFDGLLRRLPAPRTSVSRVSRPQRRALPFHAVARGRRRPRAGPTFGTVVASAAAVDPRAAVGRGRSSGSRAGEYSDDEQSRCAATDGRRHEIAMQPALARADARVRARPAARKCADDHGPAHPRHALPGGARRARDAAGRLRHRQDGAAGGARQMVRRRRDRLRRLRRARQRDGRGARRVPAARGPAHRAGRSPSAR